VEGTCDVLTHLFANREDPGSVRREPPFRSSPRAHYGQPTRMAAQQSLCTSQPSTVEAFVPPAMSKWRRSRLHSESLSAVGPHG
jgi:hypothetical protein